MIPLSFKVGEFNFKDYVLLNDLEKETVRITRNHPKVQMEMKNKEVILKEAHKDFLDYLKSEPTKRYFYVSKSEFIGAIYLTNIEIDSAELGVFLEPSMSGKGYALAMLTSFLDYISFKEIYLEVRRSNERAIRLYEKLGFKLLEERREYLKYRLKKLL